MKTQTDILAAQRLITQLFRPFGYERVYLPLYKVADTPFHIQGSDFSYITNI